jgi:aminopeptidase N
MKILCFMLGEENFSKALAFHFKKFAFKNATFTDLLESMQMHFPIKEFTLKEWKESWINKAGLNTIELEWDPSVQGASQLVAKQSAVLPDHPTLRYHLIKVGFLL